MPSLLEQIYLRSFDERSDPGKPKVLQGSARNLICTAVGGQRGIKMKYNVIKVLVVGLLATGLWGKTNPAQARIIGMEQKNTEGQAENKAVEEENLKAAETVRIVNETVETDSVLACGGIQAYLTSMRNMSLYAAGDLKDEDSLAAALGLNPETSGEAGAEESENEYADLAIANVTNYVNVRSLANTDSAVVGKIYDGAVAQILETVDGENGQWFKIISGNVEGYIKSDFFLYGDAAAEVIDDYVTRYAVVLADRLNVREDQSMESNRIGYIDNGEKVMILENLGDWLKVQYIGTKTGYVAAEYVTISEEFFYAKTLEEEAAELAAKRALEERQSVLEAQVSENTAITVTPPSGDYATNSELREQIVDYAMQFLGNRYVHGGQSLVTGTDCSGFTSLIYAEFGYSVSRTPGGQFSNNGRSISYSEVQPGDIICYGSGGKCTHVALYIGDGQIIHSANSRKGVVIYSADYDDIIGVKNVID